MIKLLLKIFVPNYEKTEDPKVRTRIGRLSGGVGIGCNVLLFAAKLLAGLLSGSVSVMADAMNNLSDAASSVVTLIGFKLAEKPADSEHPYGHARFEYLSGLAVAGMILVIGFELGKTSVQKIFHPEPVAVSGMMLMILAGSVLVKLWLSAFNRNLGNRIQSTALLAAATDSRNDVIATLAVLAAALVEWIFSIPVDGFMGLGVAAFILFSGINLAKETISPLLGEAASPELRKVIQDTVSSDPRVLGYHDLMVHDYGPGQRFGSMHVEMDQREDPLLCHEIIDNLERQCLEQHNVHLVIHYDPVIIGDPVLDAYREQVCRVLAEIDRRLSLHDFRMVKGTGHSNLIFDVVMPRNCPCKEKVIREKINSALAAQNQGTIYTVITFDVEDFNG